MGKVERTEDDSCWIYTGCLINGGYGQFKVNGKKMMAHRYAYEHFKGPISDGFVLDHLCRVRNCVNPVHLEEVTSKENTLRGFAPTIIAARNNVCLNGHDLSDAYINSSGRKCRTCSRERYESNKDDILERSASRYAENRDEILNRRKKLMTEDRLEARRAKQRVDNLAPEQKEYNNAKARAFRAANRDRLNAARRVTKEPA